MEVLEERRRLRERVISEARSWARSLPFRATAILVGSYARGDFNKWSDVDVILVSDLRGSPLERLSRVDHPPGYEVIPLTPSEFLALLRRGNPLAVEAAEVGVVLRDDFGLLGTLSRSRGRPGGTLERSSGEPSGGG
ncbi:MAG: nucleotidyltransferase domain-containing protein [Thermoprotei archaeon]|nr:MAG: nucleotidyltransferase domain-containing protein [Thermoprotei archaeon]